MLAMCQGQVQPSRAARYSGHADPHSLPLKDLVLYLTARVTWWHMPTPITSSPIYWFTPQTATTGGAESGTPSGSPMWTGGSKHWGHHLVSSQAC